MKRIWNKIKHLYWEEIDLGDSLEIEKHGFNYISFFRDVVMIIIILAFCMFIIIGG